MKYSLPSYSSSRRELATFSSSHKRGFTLVELMIAISIVAILSTIGVSIYGQSQKLARDGKRKADLRQIKNALFLYYQDFKAFPLSTGGTPPAWTNSFSGGTWITGLTNNYIDAIPQDPLKPASTCTMNTTATCYLYGYFTLSSGNANCPASNQHFVLAANLENINDPQANNTQRYALCDGSYADGSTGTANKALYIIANNN